MTTMASRPAHHSQFPSGNYFIDLLDPSTSEQDLHRARQNKYINAQVTAQSRESASTSYTDTVSSVNNMNYNAQSKYDQQEYILSEHEKKRYSQLYNINDENILKEIIMKRNKQHSSIVGLDLENAPTATTPSPPPQFYNSTNSNQFNNNGNIYDNQNYNTPTKGLGNNNTDGINRGMINSPLNRNTPINSYSSPTSNHIPAMKLKTPTSYIQTVTVLSDLENNTPSKKDKTTLKRKNKSHTKEVLEEMDAKKQMDQYFQNFSKFHHDQEINHNKRVSARAENKVDNNSHFLGTNTKTIYGEEGYISPLKVSKLNKFFNKLRSISGSTHSSIHDTEGYSKKFMNMGKDKKKKKRLFKQHSIHRSKSKSFKTKHNVIVNRQAHLPNFTNAQGLSAIIDYCQLAKIKSNDPETEQVYTTLNEKRASHFANRTFNIKPRYSIRYNKHYKLKNYSSSSDLYVNLAELTNSSNDFNNYVTERKISSIKNHVNSRKTKHVLTRSDKNKLIDLWKQYLKLVVYQRIMLRLNIEKDTNVMPPLSTSSSMISGFPNQSFFDLNTLHVHVEKKHSRKNTAASAKIDCSENEHSDMYSIESIIKEYILKRRATINETNEDTNNSVSLDMFSEHNNTTHQTTLNNSHHK